MFRGNWCNFNEFWKGIGRDEWKNNEKKRRIKDIDRVRRTCRNEERSEMTEWKMWFHLSQQWQTTIFDDNLPIFKLFWLDNYEILAPNRYFFKDIFSTLSLWFYFERAPVGDLVGGFSFELFVPLKQFPLNCDPGAIEANRCDWPEIPKAMNPMKAWWKIHRNAIRREFEHIP